MKQNEDFRNLNFLLVFFCGILISKTSSEKKIAISIAAGTEECFYETLKTGQVIDIDYQVIDGGQGSYEISFYLASPAGRTIVMDIKKPQKSHRIEVDEEGDYKLCFDNQFSTFNTKAVYFELLIEAEDGSDVDMWELISGHQTIEEQYNVALKDIEESVKRVKLHLLKIRHLQEAVRTLAAKEKNILEGNFFRVNSWSIIEILVLIAVRLVQVIMVKSWFDEQSKVSKIWKKTLS